MNRPYWEIEADRVWQILLGIRPKEEMKQNSNDYELVEVSTGREIFRGTFPLCHAHILNDSMRMVLTHEAAEMYREELAKLAK